MTTIMLNFFNDDPLLFRRYFFERTEGEVNTGSDFLLYMLVAHIGIRCSLDDYRHVSIDEDMAAIRRSYTWSDELESYVKAFLVLSAKEISTLLSHLSQDSHHYEQEPSIPFSDFV